MNQRETRPSPGLRGVPSPELAQQTANLDVLRRIYETDVQELRRRISAIEQNVHVQSHAEVTAREVELRDRYGRLGLPR
jgi:hypothetical protein